MSDDVMLTTRDNPYDPFDQWDEWLQFDIVKQIKDENYTSCCAILDRVCITSNNLSEHDEGEDIDRAINEIIAHDPNDIYCVARRKNKK